MPNGPGYTVSTMDNDQEPTLDQSDTGNDQDHGAAPSRSEAEELEALIRDLADAYDHQQEELGGVVPTPAAGDGNAASVHLDLDPDSNGDGPAGQSGSPSGEESVDDIIGRLLSDTQELGRLNRESREYQPLIEEIETLWRQLREIWPAVQLHPQTAARLEELWNTLKTGSDVGQSELDKLFSTDLDGELPVIPDTDVTQLSGVTTTDDTETGAEVSLTGDAELDAILQRVTDEPVPSAGDSGDKDSGAESGTATLSDAADDDSIDALLAGFTDSKGLPENDDQARSRTAAITESVDDIIARILGDSSTLEPAAGDPWRDAPAVDANAPTNADDEMAEYLASLDIDVNAIPERSAVDEDDIRRYLDTLDADSVETTDGGTGDSTEGAAAGLSYISDEERAILSRLLDSDEASPTRAKHSPDGDTALARQAESGSSELTPTAAGKVESLDDELARILNDAGVTPDVTNDQDASAGLTEDDQILEASRGPDDQISTATAGGSRWAREAADAETAASPAQSPSVTTSWQQRLSDSDTSVSDKVDTESISAGERTVREQSQGELSDEGGNWLIPLVAAILVGAGLWLLWGMLDDGADPGTTLTHNHPRTIAREYQQSKSENAPVSEQQTPTPSVARSTVREQPVAPTTPVEPDTAFGESTFVRNEIQTRETVVEPMPFVAPTEQDSDLSMPVFVPPQDATETLADTSSQDTYQGPEQSYIPPQADFQTPDQVYTPPRDEAYAEPVFIPQQPVTAEPVQAYTPPVVADVDLGPLEGALERLRHSTSDSITDLSERVTRLERLIAGLQDSIDSLLRQSTASASQSLSNLQQIQERIVVLEEGQQKVVDAAIQRDSEGYTIIVNNVDGSNLQPGQSSREIIHIVQKGDTLWAIAKKYINNPWRYPELARLSKIKNPDLIYPGDRIRILLNAKQ